LLTTVPPVVRNARRLLADADLLAENGRYASAFVLATLAFEEVGKVVLAVWGDDLAVKAALKGATQHVQKQSAAAALLLADLTHGTVHAHVQSVGLASPRDLSDGEVPNAVKALVEAYAKSEEARLIDVASAGILDATKQVGLYVDDWLMKRDLTYQGFGEYDASRARDQADRALHLLRDVEKLQVARALFLSDPVKDRLKASRKSVAGLRGRP
jgi:AbiV family abortive infection protein